MMATKCPGAQGVRQPKPEEELCPSCGTEVEIWTDELKTTCQRCKKTVTREEAPSCMEWCAYARDCVGEQAYGTYMALKSATVRRRLLEELERHFGGDTRRIEHAKRVLGFAEQLLQEEKADWHIVIPASILHDVGIKAAEEKYGSAAGHHQEEEGPPIARKILLGLGMKLEDIDEICEIIGHHHSPGEMDTDNFRVLYDADWLVNLGDEVGVGDKGKLKESIEKVFLTRAGKELAGKVYLG